MSNNELLLALSEMMDNKLKPLNEKINKIEADVNHSFEKMNKIEADMNHGFEKINKIEADMNQGFNKLSVILENEIRPDIKLLAENYLPAAKRYEKALLETESMKVDIELLKKVVMEHSEKLHKIS